MRSYLITVSIAFVFEVAIVTAISPSFWLKAYADVMRMTGSH